MDITNSLTDLMFLFLFRVDFACKREKEEEAESLVCMFHVLKSTRASSNDSEVFRMH